MSSETENSDLHIVSTVGFDLLKDAERFYKQDTKFSAETLQALYSVFGNALVRATELLENGYFRQYETKSRLRKLLVVGNRNEQYKLFPDINFCHCQSFKYQVLHAKNALTCKHVLAAKLAQISGQIKVDIIDDRHLVELLNDQCYQE